MEDSSYFQNPAALIPNNVPRWKGGYGGLPSVDILDTI
jgi:hypothetical protein